ncbi:hypothetical protein [Verrucosispora sp. ts21]|uniref:hypothetical protein n=1 Tax=Verrucosispora sp. ts21 TaxID=2069341 RepID=UPI001E5221B3|nr:hypothetical protein [Verrucosispora sp. ts21]
MSDLIARMFRTRYTLRGTANITYRAATGVDSLLAIFRNRLKHPVLQRPTRQLPRSHLCGADR